METNNNLWKKRFMQEDTKTTTYQRNDFKENTSNSLKNESWNKTHKQLIK